MNPLADAREHFESLGVLPWNGQKWNSRWDYQERFNLAIRELSWRYPQGNSGREKCVLTKDALPYVVKLAGDPSSQSWRDGLQSLFEEDYASAQGLAGQPLMAKSSLYWHDAGLPVLVQEKLSDTTHRGTEETAGDLRWLPATWHSYAQVGRDHQGNWRIFDLDAGSSLDFLSEDNHDDFMHVFTETYYGDE